MKKILIPTDLSHLADFAYAIASIIAEKTNASIEVLSIVSGPQDAIYDKEDHLKNDEGEDYTKWYAQKEKVEKELSNWVNTKNNISKHSVKIGRIENDILHYANKNQIDLIIMGTHGAAGLKQLMYGSHTEHIANKSAIPVLSLKCDRSDLDLNEFVLVSDFHDIKKVDLNVLKSIQNAFNSKLVLLRINTPHDFEAQNITHANMQKFAELNDLKNIEFSIFNALTIEEGIVAFCDQNEIDLIALGTHQKKGIIKLFRENISEDVINHIYHPILSFPLKQ